MGTGKTKTIQLSSIRLKNNPRADRTFVYLPATIWTLAAKYSLFVNSIKSFDFSTLYTTIPHDKLKSKLKEIINQCFFHKNGNRRFQYVVIG